MLTFDQMMLCLTAQHEKIQVFRLGFFVFRTRNDNYWFHTISRQSNFARLVSQLQLIEEFSFNEGYAPSANIQSSGDQLKLLL